MPLFTSVVSLSLFEMISSNLHVSDNEMTPTRHLSCYKLHEIGDNDKVLNNSFKVLHTPDQNLSTEKQLIGKARISLLQYMSKKPKKFCIKVCANVNPSLATALNFKFTLGKLKMKLRMD